MCRVTAWLGRPRTLEELIFGPAHGLAKQAYAPRFQDHGTLNADGFGAGWYVAGRAEPVRYRRAQPIWTDASFAGLAPTITTGCLLAAVRNASTGMPLDESATQPFTAGLWLFGHNGVVPDRAALAALLPEGTVAESAVDSAHLWVLVHHRLGRGESLTEALAATVTDVTKTAGGRLNLFLADGNRLAATAAGDTLFYRRDGDGVTVASEPADDEPGWQQVPDGSVLSATDERVEIHSLGGRP
jgi:glutamine amidotransferase